MFVPKLMLNLIICWCVLNGMRNSNALGCQSGVAPKIQSLPKASKKKAAHAAPIAEPTRRVRYVNYGSDATPREIWFHEMLDMPIPDLNFPGDVPLTDILRKIVDHVDQTHGADGLSFTIVPDHAELKRDGVQSLKDVTVRDVVLSKITIRSALELILQQTTDPELMYVIRDDVLLVTTKGAEDLKFVNRVYDVEHLLKATYESETAVAGRLPDGPHRYAGRSGIHGQPTGAERGGVKILSTESTADGRYRFKLRHNLESLVMEMTSPPNEWIEADLTGGAIRTVGNSLVVRQTVAGHREVVRLLNLLSE